ncbi:MAG TPA: DUF202 domain-containing protein [Pseudolabrys sp.]|nr:DUF202 domain-containing protein [Pseudolabrys sp.]
MAEGDESKQISMMKEMVALAKKQTDLSAARSEMSAARSEMSEARSYHNAERTLAVWVRTALTLMVVGLAIDRFGLLFHRVRGTAPAGSAHNALLNTASTWTCLALIALGVLMVLATGARFLAYARTWSRLHQFPAHHGPYLAPFFALMVALFGIVLIVITLLAAR